MLRLVDLHSVTGIARIPENIVECSASTQKRKEQSLFYSHHYSSSQAYQRAQCNYVES